MNDEHRYETEGHGQVRLIVPSDVSVPNVLVLRGDYGVDVRYRRTASRPVPQRKPAASDPGKRGTRVDPAMQLTPAMRAWAAKETPLVDVVAKLPEFIDYWVSVGGRYGVKVDWEATWRNGMRKQQAFAERDAAKNAPVKRPNRDAWMNR